ncbi:MAG: SIS domain-containing protein [Clostridium sp.]|jgi:D-sedoheptulose 7-phosphate isomerase|nr:SIS domain-containing protein [Clostridium sp.]
MQDRKEYRYLDELTERYPGLSAIRPELEKAYETLQECYTQGGKLLAAGNGGSCADSEHIVGELMKGFVKRRELPEEIKKALRAADPKLGEALSGCLQQALPAIALTGHPGLSTAFANDVDADMAYAQQVMGYGNEGDVFLGITTSGNSINVLYAAAAARAKGMKVIGLTGRDGGKIREMSDVCLIVPEQETFKIQELHLPVYHALCLMLEDHFFDS